MSSLEQLLGEMGPDEAGTSCDQDPHSFPRAADNGDLLPRRHRALTHPAHTAQREAAGYRDAFGCVNTIALIRRGPQGLSAGVRSVLDLHFRTARPVRDGRGSREAPPVRGPLRTTGPYPASW